MNACNPDKLTAFVDGALSEAEARRMEAHLSHCEPCAAMAREHAAIKRRLRDRAALVATPAGLAARISTALDQVPPPAHVNPAHLRPPRLPRAGTFHGPGLALAVATLVTSAGLWLSRPLWQAPPVNVPALMWHHRHAMHPPAGSSLMTPDPAGARTWLGRQLQDASVAPSLALRLRGVGVCRVDDAPAAIWMYQAERPVSLIEIYRKDAPPDWQLHAPSGTNSSEMEPHWRVGSYGGYNAVIWQASGHTFALVSDLPANRLVPLVEKRS